MSLKQNRRLVHQSPGGFRGGSSSSLDTSNNFKSNIRNRYFIFDKKNATPNGSMLSIITLPQNGGGMSSYTLTFGSASSTSNLAGGKNVAADLAGLGTITGVGQLIVSAVASILASSDLSANLVAILQAASNLAGLGDIQGAISALAEAGTSIFGTSTSVIVPYATGTLSADITPFTELSPQSLSNAVWSSQAALYNSSGTMGEKLNSAGSSVNPWTEVIEGVLSAKDVLRILLAVQAGTSEIIDNGNGTATVRFKSQDGGINRVEAEMDGSERISVSLDGSETGGTTFFYGNIEGGSSETIYGGTTGIDGGGAS
jgi:hypothetical protein